MTNRVTKTDLEQLVKVLNDRLGRPQEYGRTGNLHIQHAYGQPRLFENLGQGTREVSPRLPAGRMAEYIRAMLIGIDFAEVNLGTGYYTLPEWKAGPPKCSRCSEELRMGRDGITDPDHEGAVMHWFHAREQVPA